jgi:hypothetical protein
MKKLAEYEENVTRLDADIKEKWLAALRSGEYQQGREFLYSDGKYCCLGVLGAVCGISADKMEDVGLLTELYAAQILKIENVNLLHNGDSLEELNDNGFSFAVIADIIENEMPVIQRDNA